MEELASSVFIILFAFFFMNEKQNFRNRLIGIIIILAGLFVIAISKTVGTDRDLSSAQTGT